MLSPVQAAKSPPMAKKPLAPAAADLEVNSMAALMSLLRETMLSEDQKAVGAGAAVAVGTGEEKVEWLRSQLIGKDVEFDTPFGRRVLTYADQTASGRGLRYIEDYLVNQVLPSTVSTRPAGA